MEVMFADFLSLCMDQLYNHAVKFPGMFRDVAVPLVIRTPCGGRRGYGPTHSQSPEHLFTSVPGLTVVYGSHRHDIGELLIDAVLRWPLSGALPRAQAALRRNDGCRGLRRAARGGRRRGAPLPDAAARRARIPTSRW